MASASAATARDAALIDVEAELVRLIVVDRQDRVVGADHVAHAAADAGMGGIRPLADPVVNSIKIPRFFRESKGDLQDPFPVDAQLDRLHGTDRRAAAAEAALLLAPENLPGQILCAQCGRLKLSNWFHRPTS